MKKEKFLGFEKCMELMRKTDSQLQEDGFHFLLPYASDYLNELIREFKEEKDHGLKCWLLELICESKSLESFEILKENLSNDSESLRNWAIHGLKNLDSKEAQTELFKIGIKK
ncbi:MAG: HEAT repeat domain-containing protein [Bacteroidota bacterium]